MASPPKPRKIWPKGWHQDDQTGSSNTGPFSDVGRPNTQMSVSLPSVNGLQRLSQDPTPSIQAPLASMRPQIPPASGLSASKPYLKKGKHVDHSSKIDTEGSLLPKTKDPKMKYLAHAVPPETLEEHSIYPVTNRLMKRPMIREKPDDSHSVQPSGNHGDHTSLQHHVQEEIHQLWEAKKRGLFPPPRPAMPNSDNTNRITQNTRSHSEAETSDRDPTAGEDESTDPRKKVLDAMGWVDAATLSESNLDSSMFEEPPRDPRLISETDGWLLPPYEPSKADRPPPPTDLSSMVDWDPELDHEFQHEAQESLHSWSDCRFKDPVTPADMESIQQALEITRVDFWIRNPNERYPDQFSQHAKESYGSQHRRLQHAFCKIWATYDAGPTPQLYRLPTWMFGFESSYWKPSTWGTDQRSNAYNQCLAEMAAEMTEKGVRDWRYSHWKSRLKELGEKEASLRDSMT